MTGSDRYVAYNWLDVTCRQVCWAHLLRDFQAFVERKGESAIIGQLLLKQAALMFELWAWFIGQNIFFTNLRWLVMLRGTTVR